MTYFSEAIIATCFSVVGLLSIGFFYKNYQIGGGVILIWFSLGMFLGGIILLRLLGFVHSFRELVPNQGILLIILTGATVGALTNVFGFTAIASAPNEGEPVAILASASAFVVLFGYVLAKFLPHYFDKPDINIWALLGIFFIVAGVIVIALRNRL